MIDIEYLNTLLGEKLSCIAEPDKQIFESPVGYDGIISLIQTKGISPAIILENGDFGEFSFRPGGFEKTTQSIWVMKMVPRDGNRRLVQIECKALMREILAIFGKEAHEHNDEIGHPLKDWEWDHIPYGIRNAGANYTGYEFTLYFSEDTDLAYDE